MGKLGYPCAVATALRGHDVMGYDINSAALSMEPRQYKEAGVDGTGDLNDILPEVNLKFGSLKETIDHSDLIFVAVQTPHEALYEGVTRVPETRVDFDYKFLTQVMQEISANTTEEKVVVVISTVLPGTFAKHVRPHVNDNIRLCYNPFFIAMGTTMRDFLNPEFILFGVDDEKAAKVAETFYNSIVDARFHKTTVENAELIKVSYNTFIGMKIAFANTVMEICQHSPNTNVDDVMNALRLADRRLISGAYLSGGMGDGGGCHPRDNIALSWLSRKLDLSFDFFDAIMIARENQTEWLLDLALEHDLPVVIMGTSFKVETNIETGSPAILLRNLFEERGIEVQCHDPVVGKSILDIASLPPSVFLVTTPHEQFQETQFPKGSVVIDVWRALKSHQDGVRYIRVGDSIFNLAENSDVN